VVVEAATTPVETLAEAVAEISEAEAPQETGDETPYQGSAVLYR
jgi:hypothetical protein